MALLNLNLGTSDHTVTGDETNVVTLTGLGAHTLTVDGVQADVNYVASIEALGTPTIAAVNGADVSVDYGLASISGLNNVNYVVDGASSMDVTPATIPLALFNSQTVTFSGDGDGSFIYNSSVLAPGSIDVQGLSAGDTLGIGDGSSVRSFSYDPDSGVGTLVLQKGLLNAVRTEFNIQNMDPDLADQIAEDPSAYFQDGVFTMPVCFFLGTLIQTPTGERAIEDLAIGDKVLGASGVREVKWIGRRSDWVHRIPADARNDHHPIRITQGALADNLPTRDLLVSPWHHLLIDGMLVKAGELVNGVTIYQDTSFKRLQYLHVELDQFDVITAHGVQSESWADGGNRSYFQNVDVTALRPADQKRRRAPRPGYDAAVRHGGPEVEALQARFAARATMLQQEDEAPLMVAYG